MKKSFEILKQKVGFDTLMETDTLPIPVVLALMEHTAQQAIYDYEQIPAEEEIVPTPKPSQEEFTKEDIIKPLINLAVVLLEERLGIIVDDDEEESLNKEPESSLFDVLEKNTEEVGKAVYNDLEADQEDEIPETVKQIANLLQEKFGSENAKVTVVKIG